MDLMIGKALFPDVISYYFLITVPADGVGIKPTCPELSSPKHLFYLWMTEKNFLCSYAFCYLGYSGWGQVVFIRAYLHEMHLVSLPYSHTHARKRLFDFSGKTPSSDTWPGVPSGKAGAFYYVV